MHCPDCGRFMSLVHSLDCGKDIHEAAFWWCCSNDWDCLTADKGFWIPASEYDWNWWCEGIPEIDLIADRELRVDYLAHWDRYPGKYKVKGEERAKIKRLLLLEQGGASYEETTFTT